MELFDKDGELLIKGNEIVIDDEVGDLYFHKSRFDQPMGSETGEGFRYGAFKPRAFHIESSSVRTRVIFEDDYFCLRWPYRLLEKHKPLLYRHKGLEAYKEVIVYHSIPRVDFVTRINNKHPDVRIRLKFDTGFVEPSYVRETQFGVITEPIEQAAGGYARMPSLTWIDYGDEDRGITFITRGVPINEVGTGHVFVTLLRSVSALSADGESGPVIPTPDAAEFRSYTFEYALYTHTGSWKESNCFRPALEFTHHLVAVQAQSMGKGEGALSFMELTPDNLVLSALKKPEDGDGVILRFFETKGERVQGRVRMAWQIDKASIVDMLEREEDDLEVEGNELEIDVNPFEIVTLKLKLKPHAPELASLQD
jgi:alpha-mannosidase